MQTRRTITTILAAAALVAAPTALAIQPTGSGQQLGGNSMARALARRLSRTNNDSEQANKKGKHPNGLGRMNGARRNGHRSHGSISGGRGVDQPGAGASQPRRQGSASGRHSLGQGASGSPAGGRPRKRQKQRY
ncbi:MAG TPA: hypothetical protein VFA95_04790 [Gammaproteobacteria bacterium]|nr:hypothetical protein [Gammaproteobacteria bacterium]